MESLAKCCTFASSKGTKHILTMKTQMNLNEKLTEHFTLMEMVRSATAIELEIINSPTPEDVVRMKALCENVLEPLRKRFGVIRITSGFRCKALNIAVGGVKNSQHMKGEAADIHVSSLEQAEKMAGYAKDHLVFDQLLIERRMSNGCCWIHVSYVIETVSRKNRKQLKHLTV